MNKTIKFEVVALALLLLCGSFGLELFAEQKAEQKIEQKKDVSDPVLQEIISAFSSKMPRFIDKHGKEVFVADAPVTRGALMLALYEYDKSFKTLKKDTVSKQEFAELASKVNQLEGLPTRPLAKGTAPLDTMQIINDLIPNMPGILDSSLDNSKVFQSLKAQVAQRPQGTPGANDDQYKSTIDQTRYELQELVKKVDYMERSKTQTKNTDSLPISGDTRNMLATTRTQLNKLEERVSEMEKERLEPQSSSQVLELSRRIDNIEKFTTQPKKLDTPLLASSDIKKSLALTRLEMDKLEEKMTELEKRKSEPQGLNIDNSLNNSKVFQNLKDQVAQRQQGSNDGQFKTTLDQTRYELLDLAKRVDNMEKINSQSKNLETSGDIKKNLVMTHAQLDKLEAKINDIEKRRPDIQVAKKDNSSGSDDGKAYSSTLARVSMGLSMVAALFIAR